MLNAICDHTAIAEAPKRAWKFGANEEFKKLLASARADNQITISVVWMSGSLAGVSEALVNCPFETVKVRMQSKEFISRFKGTTDCLTYLLKNEGISSV